MPSTFRTNPVSLEALLKECEAGTLQLPDFQRSWVWDDERIRGLLASVSEGFPVGALMTLDTGGHVDFKPRKLEGTPPSTTKPQSLLLDGQQRMTSLYQTTMRKEVVRTITARRVKVSFWYYIDMQKALDPQGDREEAFIGVPEDRKVKAAFGKTVELDLSSPELEYESLMFPVNRVFDWDAWQDGFGDYWIDKGDPEKRRFFQRFKNEVLQNFKHYQVPVIALGADTTKEAVCLVFEKVNTGGKPLDAFELVTAMYAADGFELRKDWIGGVGHEGRETRLKKFRVLSKIASTEFLQAISLLHTRERRAAEEKAGKKGRELPAVSATRQSLLSLPLSAYKRYADKVEEGLVRAAKFLHTLRIYREFDLPYQTQLVPLAAILAELGDRWDHEGPRQKLTRWYWNGVFGELYGSAVESRFAKDVVEVLDWIDGKGEPGTVVEATFRSERLRSMVSRLSAAYKGMNALLMKKGAQDFRSGQDFDHTVFFNENVDIHHIFPKDWCKQQKPPPLDFDSIINKTPLSARTNRIIGGVAPSVYIGRLEKGRKDSPAIPGERLDAYLASHLIDPTLLRADDYAAFVAARQQALIALIEDATGKSVHRDHPGTAEIIEIEADTSDEDAGDAILSSTEEAA